MKRVNVYLFSETDFEDNVIPVQYELTDSQLGTLLMGVEKDVTLLCFGKHFHHTDDIIKFSVLD
jgi:hypothetical protein